MNKFTELFGDLKPIIGVIHTTPLLGYPDFEDMEEVIKKALYDVNAFEQGGVSAIIIENNYDIPHTIKVGPETVAAMTYIITEISRKTKLPLGVNVLWNDYEASLAIAKVTGAQFIRIPVFVDHVKTSFGEINPSPIEINKYKHKIKAEEIIVLADIQVKHAEILDKKELITSAEKAIKNGADGIIVTGKWTGDPPEIEQIKKVREKVKDFPILIGSGATKENISYMITLCDGVIISTSLKTGSINQLERNLKNFEERIDTQKVRCFVEELRKFS